MLLFFSQSALAGFLQHRSPLLAVPWHSVFLGELRTPASPPHSLARTTVCLSAFETGLTACVHTRSLRLRARLCVTAPAEPTRGVIGGLHCRSPLGALGTLLPRVFFGEPNAFLPSRTTRPPGRRTVSAMMDLESQAVPSSQDPAPVDTPRDGIARVTEDGSPDENRDVGLGGPVPPPAKRARTATAPERVKSFDGAKQFIAQLREAEAGGGEAEALGGEPGGGETAVEAKDTAPARIHETANGEHDPATENENAPNVSANPANPNPPTLEPVVAAPDKQTSPPRPESNQHQGQGRYPGHGHQATLDEIEEDAIHVLSGLFEDETMSQALSDANTGLASARNGKARRSSVSKPPCSSSGGKSAADKNTWTGVVAARTNAGTTSGNTSSQAFGDLAAGPSGSRKAADHRRLLKSYMKVSISHLPHFAD